MAEWSNAADCKSAGSSLRWFESNSAHQVSYFLLRKTRDYLLEKIITLELITILLPKDIPLNYKSMGSSLQLSFSLQ